MSTLEPDTLCDGEAERMFAQAFPTLHLTHFSAIRKSSDYTANRHTVCVSGAARDVVRSGIITADLLPPGRKRTAFHWLGEPRNSTWVALHRFSTQPITDG
jgi:hypothetical protein